MSQRPGRITDEIAVDLPRPRTAAMYKEQAFFSLVNRVSDALFGGVDGSPDALDLDGTAASG
jgi:ABC-type nitrate/sulfonate/bicarbonate transport system ATPase subunit